LRVRVDRNSSLGKTRLVHRADAHSDVIQEVRARIRARRLDAERVGDQPGVSRFRAMEAVLATGFIPLACPEAISIAGDAAVAAASGLTEPEWYPRAVAGCNGDTAERTRLDMAVRLLRGADLWPWGHEARREPQGTTHDAAHPSGVLRPPAGS
jgi:hypothetical protein